MNQLFLLIKCCLLFFYTPVNYLKASLSKNSGRPNFVFILVDDLRPLPEVLGIKFPNIDTLAANGIKFKNAYSQQALCAPSRNSLLTSRRPDSLKLYDFYSYWRQDVGNFTTLPQYFKENGYDTYSIGKVFHPGKSSNYTDDYPYSWSKRPYHPSTQKYKDDPVCTEDKSNDLHSYLVCPVNISEQPEKTLPDLQILDESINMLNYMYNRKNKSFFLAVGFHKPHIPLKCPEKYWKLHPLKDVPTPNVPFRPYGMPLTAWHPWSDVRCREDIKSLNISFPFGQMTKDWTKKVIQGYLACTSYIDDLVGQLLKHVDASNTIVVLTSDHGWLLGENGLWAKYSNFDVSLKVPLIIKVPGVKPKIINEPVELLDIFPTLVQLANIDKNISKCTRSKQIKCYEGKSLVPLLKNETLENNVALSQYPRPSIYPQKNSDKPKLKDIKFMGYSMRTNRFRYTEWISFDSENFKRNWSNIFGTELYDHEIDNDEALNLFGRPGIENITRHFSALLKKYFHN